MVKRNFNNRSSIIDTENDNDSDVSDVCPEDLVNMVKVRYMFQSFLLMHKYSLYLMFLFQLNLYDAIQSTELVEASAVGNQGRL